MGEIFVLEERLPDGTWVPRKVGTNRADLEQAALGLGPHFRVVVHASPDLFKPAKASLPDEGSKKSTGT
jgi:hypothetical protein